MTNLRQALVTTFTERVYAAVAISFTFNLLALDYVLLSQSTSYRIMAVQNTAAFNWSLLSLSVATAVLFGLALAMLLRIFSLRQTGAEATPSTFTGTLVAAVASGCPVCGAWLLPLFGIAGSLAVFPFQGLELRVLAILLLAYSILRSADVINGVCQTRGRIRRFAPGLAVSAVAVTVVFALPYLPDT